MGKVIDTGRLILRRFTLDDLQAFHQLASRPEIIRYAQSTSVASLEEARELMHAAGGKSLLMAKMKMPA